MSVPEEARSRWVELVDAINEARERYYQHDAPTISDEEYDAAYRELVELGNLAATNSQSKGMGPISNAER